MGREIDVVVERAVDRAVETALKKAVAAGAIDDAIGRVISRSGVVLQRWVFEAAVAGAIWRADRTQTQAAARARAVNVVNMIVEEAGEYGAPDYAWDLDAAHTCARELEISYW